MQNFLENIFLGNELYHTILAPVCGKYNMTHTEMVILLFLAHNPHCDTASDIVRNRRFTKSSVSMAVRNLQERGLVTGEFTGGNRRSIHLSVSDQAHTIVEEAAQTQNTFFSILSDGFSPSELETFNRYFERVSHNIRSYGMKKT